MDDARLAFEERLDDRAPNALALPCGHDCDRGQLTAAVGVRLDLAYPDHRPILLGQYEVRPIKPHGRQLRLLDEATDRGLLARGRGTDGRWHPGASRLSPGFRQPSLKNAARPQHLRPPPQPHRV